MNKKGRTNRYDKNNRNLKASAISAIEAKKKARAYDADVGAVGKGNA